MRDLVRSTLTLLAALVLLGTNRANAGPPPQHAHPELLADVAAIRPGKPFTVGVLFHVDPGWHIYWTNPGDAGRPTTVKLSLPDGFTAGEFRYPVPHKFVQPGDIVAYGYEDEVMLTAVVTLPKALPTGKKIDIRAAASWLVCADICVPGKAPLALSLDVSSKPTLANEAVFDRWTRLLPVDPEHSGAKVDRLWLKNDFTLPDVSSQGIAVEWKKKVPTRIDFYPPALDSANVTDITVSTKDKRTLVLFSIKPLQGQAPDQKETTGLLVYTDDAGVRRGISVPFDSPAVAASAKEEKNR